MPEVEVGKWYRSVTCKHEWKTRVSNPILCPKCHNKIQRLEPIEKSE